MPAPFVWFDLCTDAAHTEEAIGFYAELLGWSSTLDRSDSPYAGWIMDGEQPWGAVVAARDGFASRWIPFVRVDDLDAATARASGLGATITAGPTAGPAGVAVTITDPNGATFALWTPHATTP